MKIRDRNREPERSAEQPGRPRTDGKSMAKADEQPNSTAEATNITQGVKAK